MNNALKKSLSFLVSGVLSFAAIVNSFVAYSYEIDDYIVTDDMNTYEVVADGEKYKDLNCYSGEAEMVPSRTLPSYVDLSTDPCFPPLGNQGSLGSCVAFATTYYQFTFEVNKMNNVTSSSNRVIYSPKWTFNMIRIGNGESAAISDAYLVLERYGSLKLTDLPYDSDYTWIPGNLNLNSNEMVNEKIEALNTRVSNLQTLTLPNSGTPITSSTDPDLQFIKTAISSGKILTVCTNTGFNYKNGTDHNNNTIKVNYRCYNTGAHSMAIVGYDDNVQCDVNGNGSIEACEKGAFKLANSYGTTGVSNDTNGYKWVLYDALNKVSANTVNNWESNFTTDRVQAFCQSLVKPTFWMITVSQYTPYYIGEAYINTGTNNLSAQQFQIGRATAGSGNVFYAQNNMLPETGGGGTYLGKMLFDYDDLCTPIHSPGVSYLSGYDWYINFINPSCTTRLRIMDSKQIILATSVYTNSVNPKHVTINTRVGDINYNGVINNYDAQMIIGYDASTIQLSNLQKILADFNQDGIINMADYVGIQQYIAGGGT